MRGHRTETRSTEALKIRAEATGKGHPVSSIGLLSQGLTHSALLT